MQGAFRGGGLINAGPPIDAREGGGGTSTNKCWGHLLEVLWYRPKLIHRENNDTAKL